MIDYDDKLCITAYGAVTPIGNTIEEIYDNLINHKSGIRKINKFNTGKLKTYFAGVPEIGNSNIHWPLTAPFKNGEIFYADIALTNLLKQSNFNEYYKPNELGCIVGLDKPSFNIDSYLRFSKKFSHLKDNSYLSKVECLKDTLKLGEFYHADTTSVLNAINNKVKIGSTSLCHLGLCSASAYSMIMAARDIISGKSEAVITGGISAKVSPYNIARLENMGVTTQDNHYTPEQMCRPFDKNRSGFVLAEGAILFLLEKYSRAKMRGATPLVILEGYGASLCSQHIVAPHTEEVEMLLCMGKALKNANISPDSIDLINAHATSTIQNDIHEAKAIKRIFGDSLPVISATKSQHGHLIAAAAAMEVLCIIASMKYGVIPKILNLEEIDFSMPHGLNFATSNTQKEIRYALKNAFGMGGLAASLIFKNPNL